MRADYGQRLHALLGRHAQPFPPLWVLLLLPLLVLLLLLLSLVGECVVASTKQRLSFETFFAFHHHPLLGVCVKVVESASRLYRRRHRRHFRRQKVLWSSFFVHLLPPLVLRFPREHKRLFPDDECAHSSRGQHKEKTSFFVWRFSLLKVCKVETFWVHILFHTLQNFMLLCVVVLLSIFRDDSLFHSHRDGGSIVIVTSSSLVAVAFSSKATPTSVRLGRFQISFSSAILYRR